MPSRFSSRRGIIVAVRFNLAMRQFVSGKQRTADYEAVVRALRGIPLELRCRAYAESTYDWNLKRYGESRKLKQYGLRCAHALIGKRCYRILDSDACFPPGHDHSSLWGRDGKPLVFLSQPYPIGNDTIVESVAFCQRLGLSMAISTWPSFHFPGAVLSVEYWNPNGPLGKFGPGYSEAHL